MTVQDHFTAPPLYALKDGAAPAEIRATAVRAMADGLRLPWTPRESFSYEKGLNGKAKRFEKEAGVRYVGLPYTDANTGVLTFLQYYDFETGVFTLPDGAVINDALGNSCAAAVSWGWHAVIPDLAVRSTYTFNRKRGCVPVGGYAFDPEEDDLRNVGTREIIEQNGRQTILECYAACLPADCLVTVGRTNHGNHAMMAAEAPTVVRRADGSVDPERSVMIIQDQRGRTKPHELDGAPTLISGRLRTGLTFADLLTHAFIPLTHPVLTGAAPYRKPAVTPEGAIADPADPGAARLLSTHPLIALTWTVRNGAGRALAAEKLVLTKRHLFRGDSFNFPLADFPLKARPAGAAFFELSALVSNGETFTTFQGAFAR